MQSIFKKNLPIRLLTVYVFITPFLKGMFARHLFYSSFIVLLVLFFFSIKKTEHIFIDRKVLFIMTAQLALSVISLFTGINKEEAFYGLMKGIFPFILFIVITNIIENKYESCFNTTNKSIPVNIPEKNSYKGLADKILLAIFSSGTVISFLNFLVVSTLFNSSKVFVRFGAVIEYANTLAVYLFVCSIIGFYLYFKHSNSGLIKNVILKTCIFLNTSALMLTYSRKMWVLSFFMYFTMIILYRSKQMTWSILYISSLTVLFSAYVSKASWSIGRLFLLLILFITIIALLEWGTEKVSRHIKWLQSSTGKVLKKYLLRLAIPLVLVGSALLILVFLNPQFIFTRAASIDLNTSELQERFAYYRDSINIIGDFPLTGTGHGGWSSIQYQYQTSLYSAKFVHSSLIQAALDYGIPGLLLFMFQNLLFFLYCFKALKKTKDKESGALITTIFLSGTAIILHSLLDVDFDFPIISAVFWINMALISGMSGNITRFSGKTKVPRAVFCSAAVILALVQVPPFISALYYNKGMAAFDAQNHTSADYYFNKASIFMPLSSNAYYMRGKTAESIYVQKADDKVKSLCIKCHNRAQSLDKYNPRYTGGKVNIYKASKDYASCLAELRRIIDVQPLVISYYELFAGTMIEKVEREVPRGNLSSQRESILEVINLEDRINTAKNKFARVEHTRQLREGFGLTPSLSLNIAKAYYYNGEYNMVERYLPLASQDKNLLNAVSALKKGLQRVQG